MPNRKVVFSLCALGALVCLAALPAIAETISVHIAATDLDGALAKFVLDNRPLMQLAGAGLLLALLTRGWKTTFPNKRRYFLLSTLALTLLILPEAVQSSQADRSTESANVSEMVRSRGAVHQLSPLHIQEAIPAVHLPKHGCG